MRPATYVSVVIRSHLRQLTPLPKDELLALKRSIGELASIGRNINQIAKAVNVEVIRLDDAQRGYRDFDQGAAKKFVLDPHGLIGVSS